MSEEPDLLTMLADLRAAAGDPSSRALADQCGLSHTTINDLFNHSRLPEWASVARIGAALNADPAALLRAYQEAYQAAYQAARAARPARTGPASSTPAGTAVIPLSPEVSIRLILPRRRLTGAEWDYFLTVLTAMRAAITEEGGR